MITCQKIEQTVKACGLFKLSQPTTWQPNYNGVYKYFHYLYPIDYIPNDYNLKIAVCMCNIKHTHT